MNLLGSRIAALRKEKALTQRQLAEEVRCSEKAILDYEKGYHTPSIHMLTELSVYFDVTTDYLLGLADRAGARKPQQEFYKQLSMLISNKPIQNALYYWLTYERDAFGELTICGGQTAWAGYTPDGTYELRRLRTVQPEFAISLCTKAHGAPMIVNTAEELEIFQQFGGHAIIRVELVENYLPYMLEPFRVERGWESKRITEIMQVKD